MKKLIAAVAVLLSLAVTVPLLAQFPVKGSFAGGYMYSFYVPPTSSTPWRPAWSPDGAEIMFSMSGSLWKIRVGETTAYELTNNAGYDSAPAWSPDGRWIAYTSEDQQGVNLMLLNVATGESTPITSGDRLTLDPVWSPDGKTLAYTRNEPEGRYHVYARSFDNGSFGEPRRITEPNSFGRRRLYFGLNDDHIQPSFSPDGKEMILVSNRGITLGSGAIWRAPFEADAMSKAKRILREETLYRTKPQWSPDGARILYSSHRGSQYDNLYLLPAEGGEPYQITRDDWDHFDPAWSPDGEWIVYVSNEHGLSDLRLLKTFGGLEKKIEIRRRAYRRPMGKLKVIVKDAATGKPTESRIHMKAADGKTYAPSNAYHRVSGRASRNEFFHAEGEFTVDVPVGDLVLEAVKGIEYWPSRGNFYVHPKGVTIVELTLRRMTDMNALGWWSGSDHVHMNYGGNLHNTPEYMMFEARAEDLDHIGWKIANKDNRVFDTQYFQGPVHRLSNSEQLVSIGEEYRPAWYGHINFINLTQHLIAPFSLAYEDTAIVSLYPSNTDMFRLARKQGAIGGHVHPFGSDPSTKSEYRVAQTYPVDAALESFEYLEVLTSAGHYTHTSKVWHRSLNCGFKVTASAGEDSILNLTATAILGSSRVYAYLGDKLDFGRWLGALRNGNTFVTNGPLIQFEINGEMPGGEIHLPAGGGSVEVVATLESIVPVEKFEIIFNGEVVESISLEKDNQKATFRKRLEVKKSGWYTLRAMGSGIQHPIDDKYPVAETSPVYVYVGDKPIRSKDDAEYFIEWIDNITKLWDENPHWRSAAEKKHVLDQFAEARAIYVRRAQEAE